MRALEAIVIPAIAPAEFLALELKLIESAPHAPATLLIAAHPGRLVALGRYHFYDGPATRAGVGAFRRLTGGRVTGGGADWLRIALIAASPAALLPPRDAALAPAQIINRYVRGILSALRTSGLNCFYPGRDMITLSRRELASCAFEVADSGALLFEAELALNRGLAETVGDLELLDPEGRIGCAMHDATNSTTLHRELGRAISFEEISRAIVQGYSTSLAPAEMRELTSDERISARRTDESAASFLVRGASADSGERRGRAPSQLGTIEARLSVGADGRIERAMVGGDFIANSGAIGRLERALVGIRQNDRAALAETVDRVFAGRYDFILGIGPLDNLVALLANAS